MKIDNQNIHQGSTSHQSVPQSSTSTASHAGNLVNAAIRSGFAGNSVDALTHTGIAQQGNFSGRVVVSLMGSDNFGLLRSFPSESQRDHSLANVLHSINGPGSRGVNGDLRSGGPQRSNSAIVPGSALSAKSFQNVQDVIQTEIIPQRGELRQSTPAHIQTGTPAGTAPGQLEETAPISESANARARQDTRLPPSGASVATAAEFSDYDLGDLEGLDTGSEVPSHADEGGAIKTTRDTSVYWKGLTPSENNALGSQLATRFEQNPKGALSFLSKNVNPNKIGGMIKNLLKILSNPFRSKKVLKQNCLFCAKAVDANLAQLASPGRSGSIRLYQTKMASEGALDQVNRSTLDSTFAIDGKTSAMEMLRNKVPRGKTAIITMPFKTRGFSHAMNLIHSTKGNLFVIDGQNGKTYDLQNAKDSRSFQSKYWNASNSGFPSIANIYVTGAAPKAL